jgi:uncharacterized surface protein with fasciclin (FAS1) repeats
MRTGKLVIVTVALMALALMPLAAQVRPGEAQDETALDVISEHEQTTVAYQLFGEEFADLLEGDQQLALFVPADDVFAQIDRESDEVSEEEIRALYERHVATGLASREPIEWIEWFTTLDGQRITVTVQDDGTVLLNDTTRIIEAIPVRNGIVYIIDGSLGM